MPPKISLDIPVARRPGTLGSSLHQQTHGPRFPGDVLHGLRLGPAVHPLLRLNRMVWSDGMVHHGAPGGELQDELKKHVETS